MKMRWVARLVFALLAAAALLLAGCGGGGGGVGGGGVVLSGTVLNVVTGISPNPAATVTAGGASGQTDLADGTFTLQVPSGTASITVDATAAGLGVFTYAFAPVTSATDLGFLYVGPEADVFTGRVLDAQTLDVVEGVLVTVLARTGLTDASGTYTVRDVAWSCQGDIFVQWVLSFDKEGYVPRNVPVEGVCIGGTLTVPDVLIAPESGTDPPPWPSNIYGSVTEPDGDGSAVLVKLIRRADETEAGAFVTGTLGPEQPLNLFLFWVPVGEYRLDFYKPFDTLRATANADLTDLDQPVRVDVTLN